MLKQKRQARIKANPEKYKSISRKSYYKHREKRLKEKRDYWKLKKDVISEYRRNNIDEINKTRRTYTSKRRKDPLFKIRKNIATRVLNFLKQKGFKKKTKTQEIIGTDFRTFYLHLCSTFEENYGIGRQYIPWEEVHIDHIIPLSLAESKEDIYELNHYSNLQLLFSEDNLKKSNKLDYNL